MIQMIAALQPLLVGAVLIWAAGVKLAHRHAADSARRSALARLIGERRAPAAYRLVGCVELSIGALLVLPPQWWAEAAAASMLAVGFLGYLGYAHRAAPDSSCGCLAAAPTPVSWRGFARAGALVAAGLLATVAAEHWLSTLAAHPLAGSATLLAEAAALVTLSPELDRVWLLPLRRLRARLTHPLTGGSGVPLLASVQQLQQSAAYRRVAVLLRSDVREHWEEGDLRLVCYAARHQGRRATAVFAVPRLRYEPDAVRVALVDDATGAILLHIDSRHLDPPVDDPPLDDPPVDAAAPRTGGGPVAAEALG